MSKSDSETKNCNSSEDSEYLQPCLPTLHVSRCVLLLRQFKRLKFLRLFFDEDLLSTMKTEDFQSDSGIHELSSIQGLKKVEIMGLGCVTLEQHCNCARWLKEKMEYSKL